MICPVMTDKGEGGRMKRGIFGIFMGFVSVAFVVLSLIAFVGDQWEVAVLAAIWAVVFGIWEVSASIVDY